MSAAHVELPMFGCNALIKLRLGCQTIFAQKAENCQLCVVPSDKPDESYPDDTLRNLLW